MKFKIYKENTGEKLINEAKNLGIETEDVFPTRELGAKEVANSKLQSRVRSAKSTRFAKFTWMIALVATLTSLVNSFISWEAVNRSYEANKFNVAQKVFEECFEYYANLNLDKGIDDSLIQLCIDKAANWQK